MLLQELGFFQNLIFEKITSEISALDKIVNFEKLEIRKQLIPKRLILLWSEIINGSIIHVTWNLLQKICTHQELKKIKKLEVQIALDYLDKDCCETIENFLNEVLKYKGKYSFSQKKSIIEDNKIYKSF